MGQSVVSSKKSAPRRKSSTPRPSAGPSLRDALADYFADRIKHYESTGGLRRDVGGGVTTYPGVRLVEQLEAGEPIEVQSFYVVAACRRAGIGRPAGITASFGHVRVESDGSVTAAHAEVE